MAGAVRLPGIPLDMIPGGFYPTGDSERQVIASRPGPGQRASEPSTIPRMASTHTAPNRPSPESPDPDDRDGAMGFLEHLDELRGRLIRSCIAVGAGMLVAFAFSKRMGEFVLAPAVNSLPKGGALVTTAPTEGFAFYFDVALIGGVILSAPYVTYQVWRFIAPGLYAKEKRLVVPLVVMAALGTVGGAMFSHYILFPSSMAMFGAINPPHTVFMPRIDDTFGLYKTMLLGMVAVFQLPTLVFFLARLRLVTARFLWRNMKYAILIIFILAALLTSSPDPWNQAAMAAPMLAMYVASIGIAWLVRPRGEEEQAQSGDSTGLGLVISAAVFEQARMHRHGRRRPGRSPWLVR